MQSQCLTLFLRFLLSVPLLALTACVPVVIGAATVTGVELIKERQTIGRSIDDNTLELKLRKAFRTNDNLGRKVNISVTSVNGIVLLTGEVFRNDQRLLAEALAEKYSETRKIVNELELAGKSNLASRVSDTYITAKVKGKLVRADAVPAGSVKVVTERGKVYLLGQVSRAEADAAVDRAKSVRGVTHIIKVFEYTD